MHNLKFLREHAIVQSLSQPLSLKETIERLGFVQADPIKSPATAQDLILRQRVHKYHAGDLERQYDKLEIEEDVLYAYGFMRRDIWRLMHPRDASKLPNLERKVLDLVLLYGQMHPRELEEHLGAERVINAWGGYSKATTRALEDLHYRGLLRVVRREKGIRIYEGVPAPLRDEQRTQEERAELLTLLVAKILAPAPEKTLQETINRLRYAMPSIDQRGMLKQLLRSGILLKHEVDGVPYIWPSPNGREDQQEVNRKVRFLAPFDPIVWDRRRFEHLWGWTYRFEAYTPVAKRQRGYYAMPLLWADRIIGWVNASVARGRLDVELGFIDKRPREADFKLAVECEAEAMAAFLQLTAGPGSVKIG